MNDLLEIVRPIVEETNDVKDILNRKVIEEFSATDITERTDQVIDEFIKASSIIESIIVGIPIPEIFLVRTNSDDIQLRHVMDGQHRLTAIYRFVKDKFPLTELELLKDDENYKNKKFSQLNKEIKIRILGSYLSVLEFEAFSSDDMEIELFKRYNRNTKPLEKHEMSMATFYSNTSLYITNFLNTNIEKSEKESDKTSAQLIKIYNVTSDRKNKQRNHQELCVIFSILNNGPNIMYKDGIEIADKYLEECAKAYKEGKENYLQDAKDKFSNFNLFMLKLSEHVEYPFSSAIFRGEDKRSTKFHTGVSMVLATIFYYFDVDLSNENLLEEVQEIIKCSPLGDDTYNASSTNMRNLIAYLLKKNNVFERSYKSLTYKDNMSSDIINALGGK